MFTKMMVALNAYVAGLQKEEGQGLAEYALIIVLVSIAVVTALGLVGTQINDVFGDIETALGNAQ
jgi:pilus assembly protein Flp/PilA